MSLHDHMTPTISGSAPRARARSVLAGLGFAALSYGASALGVLAMRGKGSPNSLWFRSRKKPAFQPPNWLFAPVWSALYGSIAYSGWRVWRAPSSPERTKALGLWATQLALNGAWTPLFFRAHMPGAALVDLVALDAAASAYAVQAAKVDRQAALVVAPYLGWLAFATALNGSIFANNR